MKKKITKTETKILILLNKLLNKGVSLEFYREIEDIVNDMRQNLES